VDRHKGAISVESEVGKGTVFIIKLPALAAEGG
jgi:signal transduction histidine kinase